MLLEIEGIAHTGKTTLAKELYKAGLVRKNYKFERGTNPVEDMTATFLPLAEDSWVNLVDRGHGTEWVYSNLFDRRNQYRSVDFWQLDMKLGKAGTRIIYLSQPKPVLMERYVKTGRRPEGDIPEIEGLWEQFLLDTYCKVLRVDHRFTLDEVVKSITRYVMEEE